MLSRKLIANSSKYITPESEEIHMKRTLKPLLLFLLIALCMTGCGKEKVELYEEKPPVLPKL